MTNLSRKIFVRRILTTVCVLAILFCVSACGRVQMEFDLINDIYNLKGETLEYDTGYEWEFGNSYIGSPKYGQTGQGNNNFYCMYSTRTNLGSNYDISSFYECFYNYNKYSWDAKINGKQVAVIGERVIPAVGTDSKIYGTCMGIDSSVISFCSIVGFKAPQDGTYRLDVSNISLGNTYPSDGYGDGVKLSVYAGRDEVYTNSFSDRFQLSYCFEINVSLKKNEYMYFIIDPLSNTKNDRVYGVSLTVKLDTSYVQMHIDNDVAFGFGDVYYTGAPAHQGAHGWYYLYGDKNQYGVYKTDSLSECELDTAVQNDYCWLGENNARIEHSSGVMLAGENTAAAVALKIPRKGAYAVDIYFNAEAIGKFSVYCGDRRIRVPSFEETEDGHMSFEAMMEENEMFYFMLNEGSCQPNIAIRKITNITGVENID